MKILTKIILAILLSAAIYILSYQSDTARLLDDRLLDLLSKDKPAPFSAGSSATIIVEIDEASLRLFGQWPWPRLLLAKSVENILEQRPAAVGIDIIFPEIDRTSPQQLSDFYRRYLGLDINFTGLPPELRDHDKIFAHALSSGPTVLPILAPDAATSNTTQHLQTSDFLPLPEGLQLRPTSELQFSVPLLQDAAAGFGFFNAFADKDGVFRRQQLLKSYLGRALPNLALAMLRQVDPQLNISAPENPLSPAQINVLDRHFAFSRNGEILSQLYPQKAFTRISMSQVLSGAIPASLFSGKLILIGATASGLYDQYVTSSGHTIPGVFIHAALLENIMQGEVLYRPWFSRDAALLISLFCSLLLVWLIFERHYLLSWGVFLLTTALAFVFAWQQFGQGRYISLGYFIVPYSLLFFIFSLFFAILHYIERKRFLEDLGEAHSATIDSMTMVAESRDVETGVHIIRTKEYVLLLAEYLRANINYRKILTPHVLELLYRAAPLHDIGKVGIPDVILKKPGRLTDAEIEIMRSHVGIGRTVIENAINSYNQTNEFLTIASNITYAHHEKWDGSGYPLGLAGDEIPLEGRLMALADVYDALISKRCYKEPYSFDQAEAIIIADSGKHFDPEIISAFVALKDDFRAIASRYGDELDIAVLSNTERSITP